MGKQQDEKNRENRKVTCKAATIISQTINICTE